jgi:hypothetical protein
MVVSNKVARSRALRFVVLLGLVSLFADKHRSRIG